MYILLVNPVDWTRMLKFKYLHQDSFMDKPAVMQVSTPFLSDRLKTNSLRSCLSDGQEYNAYVLIRI